MYPDFCSFVSDPQGLRGDRVQGTQVSGVAGAIRKVVKAFQACPSAPMLLLDKIVLKRSHIPCYHTFQISDKQGHADFIHPCVEQG